MQTRRVSILGSTGSIGRQALDVIRTIPDSAVLALAARHFSPTLLEQVKEFLPEFVAVYDERDAEILQNSVRQICSRIRAAAGPEAVAEAAAFPGVTHSIIAAAGADALKPTISALSPGRTVCLATKEVLVAGGELVMRQSAATGAKIIPVDSEHSAIWQCLQGESCNSIARVTLTASGGPFLRRPLSTLHDVTVSETLQHPTWSMGPKITVDSATMMNKGLEILEAMALFGLNESDIDVIIHPESTVHALVTMKDGSTLAQLSPPDMRLPIQYALTYPDRASRPARPLNLAQLKSLNFEQPDPNRFPALELAREAARRGKLAPCALSAANEEAVALFLNEMIAFPDISKIVAQVLDSRDWDGEQSVENILHASSRAREMTQSLVSVGVA